jgi:glycosyltransferase involved in cell wall biosynthesis
VKILFLIEELNGGGKERRLTELLKGLSQDVGSLEVYLILSRDSIDYPEILDLPITIHFLESGTNFSLVKKYYLLFNQLKPDVIHSWSYKTSFYASILKPFFSYRLISGFVGDTFGLKKAEAFVAKYVIYKKSDAIISNSQSGLNAYKCPTLKSHVICNGFDTDRISSKDNKCLESIGVTTPLTVLMLANVTPFKDYQLFIDVAKHVISIRDDVTFISIGKILPEFQNIADPYIDNRHPKIKFLGFRDDTADLIKDGDLGLLCTYTEGVSNAVIELMANQIPVITNDQLGASRELIDNNVDGVICSNADIFRKTLYLLNDVNTRKKMGKSARFKILNSFSLDRMVDRYKDMYLNEYKKIEGK